MCTQFFCCITAFCGGYVQTIASAALKFWLCCFSLEVLGWVYSDGYQGAVRRVCVGSLGERGKLDFNDMVSGRDAHRLLLDYVYVLIRRGV